MKRVPKPAKPTGSIEFLLFSPQLHQSKKNKCLTADATGCRTITRTRSAHHRYKVFTPPSFIDMAAPATMQQYQQLV